MQTDQDRQSCSPGRRIESGRERESCSSEKDVSNVRELKLTVRRDEHVGLAGKSGALEEVKTSIVGGLVPIASHVLPLGGNAGR